MSTLNGSIAHAKQRIWNDPESADDLETLGILVSQHCEWDIDQIAKVIHAALEDSNYHTLNEEISKVINDHLTEIAFQGVRP
jgi:hypothetical protein